MTISQRYGYYCSTYDLCDRHVDLDAVSVVREDAFFGQCLLPGVNEVSASWWWLWLLVWLVLLVVLMVTVTVTALVKVCGVGLWRLIAFFCLYRSCYRGVNICVYRVVTYVRTYCFCALCPLLYRTRYYMYRFAVLLFCCSAVLLCAWCHVCLPGVMYYCMRLACLNFFVKAVLHDQACPAYNNSPIR